MSVGILGSLARRLLPFGLISAAACAVALAAPSPAVAAPAVGSTTPVTQQDAVPLDHGFCTNWRPASFGGMTRIARVPAIGTTGTTHCLMSEGAQGGHVGALQRSLVHCYGRSVGSAGIDSDWGPATTSALRFAQDQENILIDGIYGPQTRNALEWPVVNLETGSINCVEFEQLVFGP